MDMGYYYLEIAEEKTMDGITPANKWLVLDLVFAEQPSEKKAYDSTIDEITKIAIRGMDVHAYVMLGDKSDSTTWLQMKEGAEGVYIGLDYDPKSKNIIKKVGSGRGVVKHLP